MILTVCTRAQLAGALALGTSVRQQQPDQRFIVGVADDPNGTTAVESHSLLTLSDTGLTTNQLTELSARYTPTEFCAAVKPGFIRTAFERFPDETALLYLAPSAFVYHPLTPIFNELARHTILLNPHWLTPPTDSLEPDEKHLQNVGLYSSGFIGFRRDAETMRMLNWWEIRCHDHAAINFCIGSCLDGLWLMHVPTLFDGVGILKNPALQVALWNLPQRQLIKQSGAWFVEEKDSSTLLLSADFLGLSGQNEGLFQHQNRLRLADRPDVRQLLKHYRNSLIGANPVLSGLPPTPTYGAQPEPITRTGWRRTAYARLTQLSKWIDTAQVKPLHR
jgi:hypothetical protein